MGDRFCPSDITVVVAVVVAVAVAVAVAVDSRWAAVVLKVH